MVAFSVAVALSFPPVIQERTYVESAIGQLGAARAKLTRYMNEDVAWMTKACGFDARTARKLSIGVKGVVSKHGDDCETELRRIAIDSPKLTFHQVLRICRDKKLGLLDVLSVTSDLSVSQWPTMLPKILSETQLKRLYEVRAKKLVREIVADMDAAKLQPKQKRGLEADLQKWATSLKMLSPRPLSGEPWKQAPEKILQRHLKEEQLKNVRAQDTMFVNGKALHESEHTFLTSDDLRIQGVVHTPLKTTSPLTAQCVCIMDEKRVIAQMANIVMKPTPDGLEYTCSMARTKAPTSLPSRLVVTAVIGDTHVDLVSWPIKFKEPPPPK